MRDPVIKNQVLSVLYKAADSFTSKEPIKLPGIKGEPGSANLHPQAAGATSDDAKTAAAAGCAKSRMAPRKSGRTKMKRAGQPMGMQARPGQHSVDIPPELVGGTLRGATLGSMALPGAVGAGVGAGYGLLNPGRDEDGNRKSRLLAALKYGLLGGAGGAAAGPLGVAGALGGGAAGFAHGANKLQGLENSLPPSGPLERRASAKLPLAVKLAMLNTTTPQRQALPIGQGATQRQKDQAQATLKQNGRSI